MEIVIILVVLAVGLYWFFYRKKPTDSATPEAPYKVETPLDVNKDGQVNLKDVKAAVVKVADVNKDGQVNAADVKVVTTKAKTAAKKVATKAKTTVTKAKTATRARKAKPASQA